MGRVLVLGGTRFIGPFVVRGLVERGHSVTVFHRGQAEPDLPPEVRHVHGDFAELDRLVDRLRAWKPDVVVDMLAVRQRDGRRARAFKGICERAVVLSSVDVYLAFGRLHRSEPGPPEALPLTELSAWIHRSA